MSMHVIRIALTIALAIIKVVLRVVIRVARRRKSQIHVFVRMIESTISLANCLAVEFAFTSGGSNEACSSRALPPNKNLYLQVDCPTNSVPAELRQTGMEGAWNGKGSEALTGADRERRACLLVSQPQCQHDRLLAEAMIEHGVPEPIHSDNGPNLWPGNRASGLQQQAQRRSTSNLAALGRMAIAKASTPS
jgi:hypothetical protein